jgi:pimeloyl-ACP methyl ester carboxylesterase
VREERMMAPTTRHCAVSWWLLCTLFLITCTRTITEQQLFRPYRYPYLLSDEVLRKDVALITGDSTTIHGCYFHSPDYTQSMIRFCGNAATVYSTYHSTCWLAAQVRCNVLVFDYRGYGRSEGTPSMGSLLSDAVEIYEYLRDSLVTPDHPVFIFGASLGTVFATYVGQNCSVDGLILMSPMTSAEETIPRWKRFAPWYARWAVKLKPDEALSKPEFQPVEMIRTVTCPLLVIHGSKDRIIPIELGTRVFEEAGSANKHWCEAEWAGHQLGAIYREPISGCLLRFMTSYGTGR